MSCDKRIQKSTENITKELINNKTKTIRRKIA